MIKTPLYLQWLERSRSNLVSINFKEYIQNCEELTKILTSIIKTTKNSKPKTQN